MSRSAPVALALAFVTACGDSEPEPAAVAFPADYQDHYVEVRGCRKSADHELEFIRVLADPVALQAYQDRRSEFLEGSLVLKEQYDADDDTCAGPIAQWTVMQKEASGRERLGWRWQRVNAARRVVETNGDRCVNCHAACTGAPAVGYDGTCAEP